ncbi:MAG: phosphate/phosphite/phosphonate ABC transporter substrate-binding protein [Thermodesulfobacteriota bacterium]
MAKLRKPLCTGVLLGTVVVALLFTLGGCGREGETRVVDFSKTVAVSVPDTSARGPDDLKVAVASMVSPKESFVYYRELLDYLSKRLDRKVELVQRKTYREVNDLLKRGLIDLAFICSGPYAASRGEDGFELLAAPEISGSHFYQSYLIVNKSSPYQDLSDLQGKTFAFTDQESNTGRLVPLYWLALMGERPETFFTKSVFTYSHDNSIMATAKGLVDGAAVDGLIWEYFNQTKPDVTSKTRVIRKSEPYGMPPVVASSSLSRQMKDRVRHVLLTAHDDSEGRKILDGLKIDRFIEPRDDWYDSIREMIKSMQGQPGERNERAEP